MFGSEPTLKINFVDANQEKRARRQTFLAAGVFTIIVAILALVGAGVSYRTNVKSNPFRLNLFHIPLLSQVRQLVFGAVSPVQRDAFMQDPMNILLLGVGGEGHDGSQLTDTILLLTVDQKGKRLAFTSLPRDLAYPKENGQFDKLNAIQAYAEQEYPGEGAKRTGEALGKLFSVRIDHVIKIDFSGFATFIDSIGGVDLDVQQAFIDTQYPTTDDKWMTISFKKGMQHMDGATALVFVRSRHGNNGEGTDFARGRRQQLVLLAVRQKLLSVRTLADPAKLASLYSVISRHVQIDFSPWDLLRAAPRLGAIEWSDIRHRVLSDLPPDGELVSATVNGAYMLFPKKPDWSQVRSIVQNPFATPISSTPSAKSKEEMAKLEVKNGTMRTGFAAQIAASLEKQGYDVQAFGNAVRRGYERTVIFDLTNGKKPEPLNRLRKQLDASVSVTLPSWMANGNGTSTRVVLSDGLAPERIISQNTDFLIILGEASYGLVAQEVK